MIVLDLSRRRSRATCHGVLSSQICFQVCLRPCPVKVTAVTMEVIIMTWMAAWVPAAASGWSESLDWPAAWLRLAAGPVFWVCQQQATGPTTRHRDWQHECQCPGHQQIGVLLWHIMTFSIFYIHYDTIMTLLLPLLLLQKSDYYCTLWQNPGKHYYFTYDSSIIAIITSRHYYCYYCYYDTIMAIMVIWRTYDTYDNPGLLLSLF